MSNKVYSKITDIHIHNFRNIEYAKLSFQGRSIISLKGENGAGKTSALKALAVVALHAFSRDQVRYIKDFSDGFKIVVILEDGTMITRAKSAESNEYRVEDVDGRVLYSSKTVDSMVPMEVQEVLGFIKEPETKEFLQFRSYENKLLFVDTTNSTNYKVMYDALKVDNLTDAMSMGNEEVNNYRKKSNRLEASLDGLCKANNELCEVDVSSLKQIQSRLLGLTEVRNKVESGVSLLSEINKAGVLERLKGTFASCEEVDVSSFEKLVKLRGISEELGKIRKEIGRGAELAGKEEIAYFTAEKLKRGSDLSFKLKNMSDSISVLLSIKNSPELKLEPLRAILNALDIRSKIQSEEKVSQETLNKVMSLSELGTDTLKNLLSLRNLKQDIRDLESIGFECKEKIASLEATLKECGARIEVCPHCHKDIILEAAI